MKWLMAPRVWVRVIWESNAYFCEDFERVTKWILQHSRYKVIVILQSWVPLWHIKLKWYKTFLSYDNILWLRKWMWYEIQGVLATKLSHKPKINFVDNMTYLEIDNIPLHLKPTRYIKAPFYTRSEVYHSCDNEYSKKKEEEEINEWNFIGDLESFRIALDIWRLEPVIFSQESYDDRNFIERTLNTSIY